MKKIALWEAKHPKTVLLLAVLLLIPALIGFACTGVNYDILSYLPDELESMQGEQVLDETFNTAGISIVITEDMQPKYTLALKNEILKVDGVASVIWVDTLADIGIPADALPDVLKNIFYSADGTKTMMLVRYDPAGGEGSDLKAIAEIKTLLGENAFMSGLSVIVDDTREICDSQAPLYIAVAVALALAVMALMMESWFQPLIVLLSLGIAVLYNMGTNFFLGEISFITQCVAAVLQLGVTMDYSIFLIDRYSEEKEHYPTREEAMAAAVTKSFAALAGSSLTTVFGFLALCFMHLKLGFDIGFVMAKGVVFGILTVVFVLPSIVLIFEKQIIKYRHRSFIPDFTKVNVFTLKHKKAFALVFLLLLAPSYLIQKDIDLYYSMNKALPGYLTSMQGFEKLKNDFDMACTQFVIVDDSIPAAKLMEMEQKLENMDGVSSLLAYNSIVGPAIPDDILPDEIMQLCKQDGLQLFLVNSKFDPATPELTAQLQQMEQIVKSYDPNAYITGEGAIEQGLIDTTDRDFAVTAVLSVAAIFILIAIVFKSVTLPIILVLSIELAIWLNLSLSVIMGKEASFVDPTVINCIQLGATVDYAILLTTRFREELRFAPKQEAMLKAVKMAQQSIFQSAAVFFAATFGVYVVCDIYIVRGMCALLARGAIISEFVIILFLAPLLVVCEGFIAKTTPSWRLPAQEED
ncbi:MAG TPA: antibiotic ABC transporter permease [Clostridiales bacterium]|nr:antibiotic ABC transporter permease [Clostridiales bacterium]